MAHPIPVGFTAFRWMSLIDGAIKFIDQLDSLRTSSSRPGNRNVNSLRRMDDRHFLPSTLVWMTPASRSASKWCEIVALLRSKEISLQANSRS